MDAQQNTTPFPGVVLMKSNYLLQYSGSKQNLVACGLLKDKHFPGEQGNKVTVAQIEGKEIYKTGFSPAEFKKIRIRRHDGKSKLFHVAAYFLWEIVLENENAMKFHEAKKKSMELALMWINSLPTSELNFKKRTARFLSGINNIEEGMVSKRGGYSMTKETIDKYNAAVAALVEVALNGSLNFSEYDHIKERLNLTQQAFDRHLATYCEESEREKQFKIFKSEVESQLDLAALSGSVKNCSKVDSLVA